VSRPNDEKTRRDVLKAGLAAAGGVVAAAGAASAASSGQRFAQDKIAPAQVQYQPTPKDGLRCDKCVNWEAPNACKIVSGTIAPEGWCIAFAPKES
jgi:hypothetical protein